MYSYIILYPRKTELMKSVYSKLYVLIVLYMLFAMASFAHTGSLKGLVKDKSTNKPVEGASIYIKELNIGATSDVFGAYFMKGVSDGSFTIVISHIGYEPITEVVKIEDGITAEITSSIQPSSVNMQAVTINARKEQAMSSVSGLDLKLRPVNTSQDMLRLVPGLFIAQHQGGGKAEQMFLRGFDIDHGTDVNVTVDGMPVNMVSHAHGQGYADLHFLIPELVDRMDFGKGPYQIDKGNMATAGWVGFKTKDYLDNSFVKLEAGNYGHTRSLIGINLLDKNNSNQTAYIAAEYVYNKGYFDAPQNFNRTNIIGKYTNQLSKDKMLSITLSGFRSNWEASGQIPERAVNEGRISRFGEIDKEYGKTSRYNMNVQFTQSINNHSYLKTNLYSSYYDFELYSNFTFFLEDPINGDQIRQKEKRLISGYNVDYVNDYSIGGLKTKTNIGAGFRHDNVTGNELSHTLNRTTTLDYLALGDVNETNISGYINQSFYLLPQLVLNAGTRFDYFIHSYDNRIPAEVRTKTTAYTNTFSPKAGIYYNFNDNARIYANYGTGFHSNDTRVVTAQRGNEVLPLAQSYDFGAVVKPYSKLLLSGAVWRLDMHQEFVYVGDAAVVELSGKTQRTGIDFSARYELLRWLYMDGDVNYTHARAIEEAAGENYIPLAPVFTSIGGLTAKFDYGLSGSLRYRYMGDRAANEDNSVIAKGYTVLDATLNYSLKKYEFGIQAQNLLNTKWNEAQFHTETRLANEPAPVSELHFTPGTPFAFRISATYKF